MRRLLASILGVALGANGFWMLASPFHWYNSIPGLPATGPANGHFIRDIGCAYFVSGLALLWLVVAPQKAWPAVLLGGLFLLLHAGVHIADTLAGRETSHRLLTEIPTVIVPAILAIWLGWPPNSQFQKEL